MEVHHGGAAAEVRRKLQIIYFLSRKGRSEHPHLFSVHTFCRHGVRLRDVKRWLGEFRGKEFPDSFAWSYKRKYKRGYVWEDVVGEDDILTPISDNEYVLKGSQMTSSIPTKGPMQKNSHFEFEANQRDSNLRDQCQCHKKTSMDRNIPGKTSSETSTLSDEDGGGKIRDQEVMRRSTGGERSSSSSLRSLFSRQRTGGEDDGAPQHSAGIFRNLIPCGTVDTKDSAVSRRQPPPVPLPEKNNCSEICCKKTERLGGSHRIFGSNGNKEQHRRKPMKSCEGLYGRRPFHKSPHCSQCGKPFNPEKLHSHMKSCKRTKNYGEKEDSKEDPMMKNSYCFSY